MFVVLDTNHFSELVHDTVRCARLRQRFSDHSADVLTTIVTAQEITKGWCAFIRQQKAGSTQANSRIKTVSAQSGIADGTHHPRFRRASCRSLSCVAQRLPRTGTQDLKIASIYLAHDATLLTRNTVDFKKVPGLLIENWLN